MATTPEQVLKELKQGKYSPVYFLQGEETFYIDQIADFIEENALDEASKGFNQIILYGKDIDVNTILSNAKRFPMMSERQVVIIKEAQEVKDLNREPASKMLEEYVKSPLLSTVLVFAHKKKVLDGRKSLSKTMDKHAVLVNSKKIYDNQVPAWVNDYVKSQGHTISAKASALIAENVGADLSRLANEVDKIIINFDQPTEIKDEHIERYVGISKDFNVFELQKAIGQKNVDKVNKILFYFAKDPKSHPVIPMLALLFQYFTKIMMVHTAPDKNERALAGTLGVNPFFVKDYLYASKNYSLGKLVMIVSYLREADLRSKGVGWNAGNDHAIMQELVYKVMH